MYVCVCNAVTDREIRACAELGVTGLDELRASLGVATCCGRCAHAAERLLTEHGAQRTESTPAHA
jgi:bacterioferritin-associated ferredoxin